MCKRLLVLLIFVFVSAMMRIEAQQLNYQAIARNANGVALTFRDVGIRLSIRDGSQTGSIVYSETRNVRTNQFGLFTVVIGSPGASNVLGSMASINWISGNKYLQVEIDPEGGNNYFQAGTSQLQAVPYALFANAAYPVGPAGGDLLGSNYPNPIIAPLAVTTGKIANQAITTPKIADLNVTTAKLADQAITNPKIQDNTISNIKLVNSKVTLNGLILNLGDAQDFAVGTTGTDVNIISAGKTHTFNFPDASIANRGLITPNAQTIGGNKTFNNNVTAASFIKAGGIAAQFLKADGSVDNNTYLTANQPIIVTATGDATGVSTSSGTAPVLPLTLATVNSAVGTFGNNITVPSITVNNKGLVTNVTANPIPTATATSNGLLTVGDWNTFNNKQNAIPLGTSTQYFRGDLTLGNFTTDVRNQLSAGTNITYANGNIGLTNNSVTLNTLPLALGGSQSFATGNTGTDFNISSIGTVHSFNIPTASATNRGLLSPGDFSNFNTAFTSRITGLTTTGSSGAATLSGNVLNIPNYSYNLPTATASILGGVTTGANITNTSGNISITNNNVINALGTQTANRIFASPDGTNGLPSFRALALGDIQDNLITNSKLANSSFNLGTTNIALGGTANTLTGLTSITSSNFIGPLTGNASTASAWANSRTISMTGDVTYTSNPFDGSGNTTGVATLSNSGVAAGTYGSANTIPRFTVDSKGRINSATDISITGVSTIGSALNDAHIIVGSATNLATAVPMSGDVTINNSGVTTIGANKVTDAMLAGSISNSKLTNSAITIGTTSISLGGASTTLGGLTSVNSTSYLGTWTGNIIASTYGGTGNGFTKFSGPTTSEKTFTLPNATAKILTDNSPVAISEGGTGQTTKTAAFNALSPMTTLGDIIYGGASGTGTRLGIGNTGDILTVSGAGIPAWAANSQWSVNGNSGLTSGTNFLGTTDNTALTFKVNNLWGGQISPASVNTSFGLGAGQSLTLATAGNTAFGTAALSANTVSLDHTAFGQNALQNTNGGGNNTGIGKNALRDNVSGFSNTAVGHAALMVNLNNNNSAFGKSALLANTNGTNNTGIGHNALLASISGNSNTALGQNSLSSITITHDNTAVGFESLKSSTGDGNIGLGFQSDISASVNNSISIGKISSVSSSTSIAIGSPASIGTSATNSIAIGSSATIGNNASNGIAIGTSASATGANSIAIGNGATNSVDNTIQLGGTLNEIVTTPGSMNAKKFIGKTSGTAVTTHNNTITGAAAGIGSIVLSGNDVAGFITFTTGAVPAGTGNFITITFGTNYSGGNPVVVIHPIINGATPGIATSIYCLPSITTTSTFTISTGTALIANTQYQIAYHVIGREL